MISAALTTSVAIRLSCCTRMKCCRRLRFCRLAEMAEDSVALQMAKLLIIPFVCLVERFWLQRRFSKPVIASIVVVAIGVAIV